MTGSLLVFLAVAALAGSGQTPREAVESYRRGDPGALEALSQVSERDLRGELLWIRKLVASRRKTTRDEALIEGYPFGASVLAFTDLAMRAHDVDDDAARRLYETLARGFLDVGGARTAPLAPRWFLLWTLRHLERIQLPEARRVAEEGTRTLPDDARLWLAAGAVTQAMGRFRMDDLTPSSTVREHLQDRLRTAADLRALRVESEQQLKRALQREARLHEAAVRLAQVHLELERPAEAAEVLASLPDDLDPLLAYLAHLFRGRVEEKGDRWTAAIASYRRATSLWPGAETAWLALAHALDRLDDRGAAQVALARVLAADAGARADDPFRVLPILCAGGAAAVWAEMRETQR